MNSVRKSKGLDSLDGQRADGTKLGKFRAAVSAFLPAPTHSYLSKKEQQSLTKNYNKTQADLVANEFMILKYQNLIINY